MQKQVAAMQAKEVNLHRANKKLANKLVETAHLWDELATWAHGSATMARVNNNRYVALEEVVSVAVELIQAAGLTFH